MDKIDYLILSELLKDASLSFVEIAEKVGTTPYTVRRRYEKMKKEGNPQMHCINRPFEAGLSGQSLPIDNSYTERQQVGNNILPQNHKKHNSSDRNNRVLRHFSNRTHHRFEKHPDNSERSQKGALFTTG